MKKLFTVYRDSEAFGSAETVREGLYYRIEVRCPKAARVFLRGEIGVRDLGICVPSEGIFQIKTRVPVKQVGEGELSFWTDLEKDQFYAVDPGKPFIHLDILRSCTLTFQNGEAGVQREISSPTGQ